MLLKVAQAIMTSNMEITKTGGGVGGSWLDKKELKTGDLAKLKTEATWVEGQNGKQLIAKIRVKGQTEDKNVAVNTPTRNALIDAFGTDTLNWVDKLLTIHVETGIFAGKRGVMLNLVPENFVMSEDDAGFIVIKKKEEVKPRVRSAEEIAEDINLDDVPF